MPGPSAQEIEARLSAPFHRTVLARYKCSLDLYEVREDDLGGSICRSATADPDLDEGESQYFEIRYGFRHLSDGRICVVAWLPDLEKLPRREREAWMIDHLRAPRFAEIDPAYDRWVGRNIRGEWNSAGPLEELQMRITELRAITAAVGLPPLFRAEWSPLLHPPIAENSAELLASVVELERLVVEGLDPKAVRGIGKALRVELDPQHGTLGCLRSVLADEELAKKVHAPLGKLRDERNQIHRMPAPHPKSLPAFDHFLEWCRRTVSALTALAEFLAAKLSVDVEQASRRLEIMESSMFPRIGPLGFKHPDTDKLVRTVGKTIASVEIGAVVGADTEYRRDGIALHFDDGTSLVIDPIANVGTWSGKVTGFDPVDLCVRLDATFVPSGRKEIDPKRPGNA
jgi:hypothetical protein